MQFFDSCVWFSGVVFVSMLGSVVHDMKAVLMPYLLPILLNFSDMLLRMVLLLNLWVSLVLCDYQSFCVSLLVCSVGIHLLSMLRLFVDVLYVDHPHLSGSQFWRLVTMACFVFFG